jgi:hypothetical protein
VLLVVGVLGGELARLPIPELSTAAAGIPRAADNAIDCEEGEDVLLLFELEEDDVLAINPPVTHPTPKGCGLLPSTTKPLFHLQKRYFPSARR